MLPQYSIALPVTTEPVTLDEVTAHLRVDSSDDLDYISMLISVAREYVENLSGWSLGYSNWTLTAENWESISRNKLGEIPLMRAPVSTVSSVKYYAPDSTELTTLATTEYRVITAARQAVIQIHGDIPSLEDRPDAIQIAFTAGDDCQTPLTLKHAVKMMVTKLYEDREGKEGSKSYEFPHRMRALIEQNRIGGWS